MSIDETTEVSIQSSQVAHGMEENLNYTSHEGLISRIYKEL